ncbi:Kinetochore protein mis18 [Phytophthora cinnamomi]|uniref:Kinetochore protein mis18 n=1 Tax=Phytophthora cinnamomi TaxID=4785 RepID=UPI00355A040E|nr:Kinetochore protein mis18 [Phytophthora cinnamomi]
MNGAPRKRHHAERDAGVEMSRTPSHKKARMLVTPQTAPRVAVSSRSHSSSHFRRHAVANPESEEIEEEDELGEEAVQETQSQETEEEEEVAMPLVVFQCSTCRSIFGDSYAFVCSTEDLWLVTLSHVTNVALAPEVQTANTGLDAGSSYHELLCHNCQAVLGRKYLTTPVALDGIRDLFSFSTEAITSYTLGDPMQQSEAGTDQNMQQAAAACNATMQKLAADRNELARLRDEMEKVKGLMVTVDDRLAHLEGAESEEEADPEHATEDQSPGQTR